MKIARSFNCGFDGKKSTSPGGATEFPATVFSAAPAGRNQSESFFVCFDLLDSDGFIFAPFSIETCNFNKWKLNVIMFSVFPVDMPYFVSEYRRFFTPNAIVASNGCAV
jgi:hypothetical protein